MATGEIVHPIWVLHKRFAELYGLIAPRHPIVDNPNVDGPDPGGKTFSNGPIIGVPSPVVKSAEYARFIANKIWYWLFTKYGGNDEVGGKE